jgi:GTP pyrophosphokinase
MDVYAPLADRLGISSIKWELEDLAFFYLEPVEYERIARMVQDSRAQRERDTDEAIKTLTDEKSKPRVADQLVNTTKEKFLAHIYNAITINQKFEIK